MALTEYQQAKTGALFAAATVTGAAAAGAPSLPWRLLGECLGEAYQVADDLRDVACRHEEVGKPVGRDSTLGRPNAAALLGMGGALARLKGARAGSGRRHTGLSRRRDPAREIVAQTRLFLPASLAQELA